MSGKKAGIARKLAHNGERGKGAQKQGAPRRTFSSNPVGIQFFLPKALGPVTTEEEIPRWGHYLKIFNNLRYNSHNTPADNVGKMTKLNPYYVTGFVEGEGSFYVGILPRSFRKVDWEVRPSFSVSQNKKNRAIIFQTKKFFDCGSIRPSEKDQTFKYEVRSLKDLKEKIIPHFEQYPLKGIKKRDFYFFRKVIGLMQRGKHLEKEGLRKIVELASKMNTSEKRAKSLKKLTTLLKV